MLIAAAAAVSLMFGLCACGSGSLSPGSSPRPSSNLLSPAPSESSPLSSPAPTDSNTTASPADSNPAATFSDGSRVELAGMDGGGGQANLLLKVTAGPRTTLSLESSDTFDIRPVDSNGFDQWTSSGSSRQFSYWTESPPPDQPNVLEPGQSVCVSETLFSSNSGASITDINAVNVTITLGNGSTEKVSLPQGGGAGAVCGIS
jgi:hypothetical protein